MSGPLIPPAAQAVAAALLASGMGAAVCCSRPRRGVELPIRQVTKVEMLLNLKAAKALGITVPLPVSGRADEVIE